MLRTIYLFRTLNSAHSLQGAATFQKLGVFILPFSYWWPAKMGLVPFWQPSTLCFVSVIVQCYCVCIVGINVLSVLCSSSVFCPPFPFPWARPLKPARRSEGAHNATAKRFCCNCEVKIGLIANKQFKNNLNADVANF